ncbi:ATP-binding protein [Pseudolactococcus yaeyamensis]
MAYLKRESYLQFLRDSKDKPIIKVISGVRRSGKSTLFELFIAELRENGVKDENIIQINFEYLENYDLREFQKLHDTILEQMSPTGKNYIFLDEIQHVVQFELVVDSLFVRKNVDLYITGSNAYFLSGELATNLSGRYIELKMLPLSLKEFKNWHDENQIDITKEALYTKYLKSSFPYVLFTDSDAERLNYLQGVFNTVVLKDIVERLKVSDVTTLERLIQSIFSSIGSEISVNKIVNTLVSSGTKLTNQTAARWLKGILDSLIIYQARNYDVHGRSLLTTGQKFYVVDIGLRQLLLPDHVEDRGHILENVVYLELLRRGNTVFVGKTKKYEVDFVAIQPNGDISYYQVSETTLDPNTLNRELRSLEDIDDNYPKYLLTLDTIQPQANFNGIIRENAIDWLLGIEG